MSEMAQLTLLRFQCNKILDGLLRTGFLYPQQIIWNKAARY